MTPSKSMPKTVALSGEDFLPRKNLGPKKNVKWRLSVIHRRKILQDIMDRSHINQAELTDVLKGAYEKGFEVIKQTFMADDPSVRDNGPEMARKLSYLTEQIIRTAYDGVVQRLYPNANPTDGERFSLIATGGFGRGELAPYSDIDLLFLIPYKGIAWSETVIETLLYILWDLHLKVGHAVRTPSECIRLAKDDLSIKTAFLEARFLTGEKNLFLHARHTFVKTLVKSHGPAFLTDKMKERDERHKRLGDSRFVVEPNIKEGKGALRDLHTLWWIIRFMEGLERLDDLKTKGILSLGEYRRFITATKFLWTVRAAMHYISGRAEERLSFQLQPELARFLGYRETAGLSPVERFMKHYFLTVKEVGDLTRIFCTALEARHQKEPLFSRLTGRRKKLEGFIVQKGRLILEKDHLLIQKPQSMIRIFWLALTHDLDIHPDTIRLIKLHLKKIDIIRDLPEANQTFLKIMMAAGKNEIWLRRMNEAGVLGRFVPDFGRIVAQMQFDMYHHYTVDEHTIRALGLLGQIEAGIKTDLGGEAVAVFDRINRRELLYVAVFLHDIAKGRGGDHSVLGAGCAQEFCPRLGFSKGATDLVAWLVRDHLLMSNTAFKRDLSEPKTIRDFAERVSSAERLRHLYLLTMVDIHAVGPGTWNDWKGQLLQELYIAAEEYLIAGHTHRSRKEQVNASITALKKRLPDWTPAEKDQYPTRYTDAYWLAEDTDIHEINALLVQDMEKKNLPFKVIIRNDVTEGASLVCVGIGDHPGIFARLTGSLAVIGASIVSAKIHTTKDGIAVDNFFVHGPDPQTGIDEAQAENLHHVMLKSLKAQVKLKQELRPSPYNTGKEESFDISPFILIDNKASSRSTVIEVNAKDRPGLLYDLVYALYRHRISIFSAHIATYGERAVDVFYVRDLVGGKILTPSRLKSIEAKLLDIADEKPAKKNINSLKTAQSKIALN